MLDFSIARQWECFEKFVIDVSNEGQSVSLAHKPGPCDILRMLGVEMTY